MFRDAHLADVARGRAHGGQPAIIKTGSPEPFVVPWRELAKEVEAMAWGLLDLGLEPLEAVGFVLPKATAGLAPVLGTWVAGGIAAWIQPDFAPDIICRALEHAECRIAFCTAETLPLLAGAAASLRIACLPPEGPSGGTALSLLAFQEGGARLASMDPHFLERRSKGVDPADVACYAFATGSQWRMRASKITHQALLARAWGLAQRLPILEGDRLLSRLPAGHVANWTLLLATLLSGGSVVEEPGQWNPGAPDLAQECRPTLFACSASIADDVAGVIDQLTRTLPWGRRARYSWALEVCRKALKKGTKTRGWRLDIGRRIARDEIGLVLGDDLRAILTTGASCSPRTILTLGAVDLPIIPAYTSTEGAGFLALGSATKVAKPGSVGLPLPGIECNILSDGEVVIKGETLFAGYLKDPAETDKVYLGGWFRTGDRGTWDGETLTLLGTERERGLMVRVAAESLEPNLRALEGIRDAMVYPGLPWSAILVPSWRALANLDQLYAVPEHEAVTDPRLLAALQDALDTYNRNADPEAKITAFVAMAVLPRSPLGHLPPEIRSQLAAQAEAGEQIPAG